MKFESRNGYLAIDDLPRNCIFNKRVAGCGGTTVALSNEESYVIAVPTTELITNKTGLLEGGVATITCPDGKEMDVFGLFGPFGDVKDKLTEYLEREGTKKIMCTYDKMEILTNLLEPGNYRLLVDEYQVLLKDYGYRAEAINRVLGAYRKYKSFCFMSATPLDPDFVPEELEGVETITADWDDVDNLTVDLEQTNNPCVFAANIIERYKVDGFWERVGRDGKEHKSYEAFFFVNSVTVIHTILERCKMANDDVRIICANTEENRRKLEGFTIGTSKSPSKMFTFITRKAFEGIDLFSETGVFFVVSNYGNPNTMLDVGTDIYQIAGRNRMATNPFRNFLVHIFNTAGNRVMDLGMSYEEYAKSRMDALADNDRLIGLVNAGNEEARANAREMLNSAYVIEDREGYYHINRMLIKLELFAYRIERHIYRKGISLARHYAGTGASVVSRRYERVGGRMEITKKMSFKEAFLKYCYIIEQTGIISDIVSRTAPLLGAHPLIQEAYHKLGKDGVRRLRYNQKRIRAALMNLDQTKSQECKVMEILHREIKPGFHSSVKLKPILDFAFKAAGKQGTATATAIEEYFDCKPTKRNPLGEPVRGYVVYGMKVCLQEQDGAAPHTKDQKQ